jgi:hypothetical protein
MSNLSSVFMFNAESKNAEGILNLPILRLIITSSYNLLIYWHMQGFLLIYSQLAYSLLSLTNIVKCKKFLQLFYVYKYFFIPKFWSWEAEECDTKFYHIWDNTSFSLDSMSLNGWLILGSSTHWQ